MVKVNAFFARVVPDIPETFDAVHVNGHVRRWPASCVPLILLQRVLLQGDVGRCVGERFVARPAALLSDLLRMAPGERPCPHLCSVGS